MPCYFIIYQKSVFISLNTAEWRRCRARKGIQISVRVSRSLSAAICVNRHSTAEEINNNCRAWSVLSDAIDVRLSASWLTHRQLKSQMLGPSAPGCWQHVFQFVYHKSKKEKIRGEEITKICSDATMTSAACAFLFNKLFKHVNSLWQFVQQHMQLDLHKWH